jgi:hypothetical protein
MAQAIIQQQPVDGDFDDSVDPESDISGDDNGMETDVDDTVCDVEMGKITSLLPVTSRNDVRI